MTDLRQQVERVLAEHTNDDQTTLRGALFDAGLAWVNYPPGCGGQNLPPADQNIVDEVLRAVGRYQPPMAQNGVGIGMCAPTIAAWGTDEQKAYLRDIWTGEKIWCQLFSEPGAGSDVAALATRAVRDGEDWVLNGRKVWTTFGPVSAYGLLLARTDPDVPKHQGLTAFIVDMRGPGVHVAPLRELTGESQFSEVTFVDARLPDSSRLGPIGAGWKVAVTTLMNERVAIGGGVEPRGQAIRPVVDAWAAAADYVRDNPSNREYLVELWVEAEALRLGNMRARVLREVGTPGPEGSVLKLAGSILQQRISEFTVSLQGAEALGYPCYDTAPELDDPTVAAVFGYLMDQQLTIAGGTTFVQKNIIGERILGLPREPSADHGKPWSQVPRSG